jgi:selenide, water dikinase
VSPARTHVVLVGGGHAHVELLRRWVTAPIPRTRVTLVVDRPRAVYSGMVPGFAAGDYALRELEINSAALARLAGARVLVGRASAVDPAARTLAVEGQAPVAYDVASLDVGSTVRGLDLPGVRAHALATRPIRGWVDRLEATLTRIRSRPHADVVVVGAGAAGVELGFTLRARIAAIGVAPRVTVLAAGAEVLPGEPAHVGRRVRREAAARGITIRTRMPAVAVDPDAVVCEHERIAADVVVWATGAAPLPWLAESPLPHDATGFVRVRPTLEVVGHGALFAAGDCASIDGAPWVRKAGVHAVRQGPVLERNLRARVTGMALRPYRPQRHVLSLIHLGDRRALATKWGAVTSGRWVWRAKRWVDRRFVERHRAR